MDENIDIFDHQELLYGSGTNIEGGLTNVLKERIIDLVPVIPLTILLYYVRNVISKLLFDFFYDKRKLEMKTAFKLQDSIYFLAQYIILATFSRYALKKSGYYSDKIIMFREIPNKLTPGTKQCYIAEVTVYLAGILTLISPKDGTSRKKYSDSKKMYIHHIVTLGLLMISYLAGHTIIGVLVMNLHDVCDIVIELTKTLKYLIGLKSATICLFMMILVVFLYNRGYIFIKDVLWHILVGYPKALEERGYEGPIERISRDDYPSFFKYLAGVIKNFTKFPAPMIICELLLFSLEILNMLWIVNLIQILIHYINTGVAGDIRDPDEKEEMNLAEAKTKDTA